MGGWSSSGCVLPAPPGRGSDERPVGTEVDWVASHEPRPSELRAPDGGIGKMHMKFKNNYLVTFILGTVLLCII